MRRMVLAVLLVALLSTALVGIAMAATNYVLAPARASNVNQPAVQSHSGIYTDDIRPLDSNYGAGPGQANGNCPHQSNSAASDSSPSY